MEEKRNFVGEDNWLFTLNFILDYCGMDVP